MIFEHLISDVSCWWIVVVVSLIFKLLAFKRRLLQNEELNLRNLHEGFSGASNCEIDVHLIFCLPSLNINPSI